MAISSLYIRLTVAFICLIIPFSIIAQVGDTFPLWTEGYLDIHHINTGKGDAAFFMLPDGTTLLVDAGASNRPKPRIPDVKPNDSRSPGEWISRYIQHMLQYSPEPKLDYMLLTHFHNDHMGELYSGIKSSQDGEYKLTGITEVGENLPFDKMIDRAWPDYQYPVPLESDDMKNYQQFLTWHRENRGVEVEQFKAGRNDQLALVNNPGKYPDFEIQNIAVNGQIWTGVENVVRNHFPPLESLKEDFPSENMSSIVFRLSYGKFDYFTGGDIPGIPSAGSPLWHDIETPVAKAVGPVEIHVLNHHGYVDSANEFFLSALRPKVHIIHSHSPSHPSPTILRRLFSTRIYPGPRDIFATHIMEETRIVIGSSMDKLKSQQGHIVIRVDPDGENFNIFILDDADENFTVKVAYGPYACD
jgi:beta-lactamase superfamily II metal-dependent hydrolase